MMMKSFYYKKRLKKKEIKVIKKFIPKTNCILHLERDTPININVLNKEKLQILAINLLQIEKNAIELNFKNFTISGFSTKDWLSDVLST